LVRVVPCLIKEFCPQKGTLHSGNFHSMHWYS
jgi:hypothetical protein